MQGLPPPPAGYRDALSVRGPLPLLEHRGWAAQALVPGWQSVDSEEGWPLCESPSEASSDAESIPPEEEPPPLVARLRPRCYPKASRMSVVCVLAASETSDSGRTESQHLAGRGMSNQPAVILVPPLPVPAIE